MSRSPSSSAKAWLVASGLALTCVGVSPRVEGAEVSVSGQAGYWSGETADAAVNTVFGGSPTAPGIGVKLHWAVNTNVMFAVAVDAYQGSSQKGFRQSGTRPEVVVDERVWLRMVDLHAGARLQAGPSRRLRPYVAVLAGPTLVLQRLREARFTDAFTPLPSHEWNASLQVLVGVELGHGALRIGPEVMWRELLSDVKLAQLFVPRPLDGWGVRLRVRAGH